MNTYLWDREGLKQQNLTAVGAPLISRVWLVDRLWKLNRFQYTQPLLIATGREAVKCLLGMLINRA